MGNAVASTGNPTAGDLIEFFRGPLYQHWGVCVGDDSVVHVTSDQPGSGSSCMGAEKAIVKKQKLQNVAGDSEWRVNNLLDNRCVPFPPGEIVKKAESMVGQLMPYSVTQKNCEHFATDMRYGKPMSRQVQKAPEKLANGAYNLGVLGAAGIATAAYFGYTTGKTRFSSSEKNNPFDINR